MYSVVQMLTRGCASLQAAMPRLGQAGSKPLGGAGPGGRHHQINQGDEATPGILPYSCPCVLTS